MDIRPSRDWLRNITLPLADKGVFAVSGFRSLLPRGKRFAEHLHTSFNAIQCMAMTEKRYAGMWGGSMALQRSNFEKYAVGEKWSTAMVDDLSLTAVIKQNRLKRVFSSGLSGLFTGRFQTVAADYRLRSSASAQYAAVLPATVSNARALFEQYFAVRHGHACPIALITSLAGVVPWWFAAFHLCFYMAFVSSICGCSAVFENKR